MNTIIISVAGAYLISVVCLTFHLWMDVEFKRMDAEDKKFEETVGWL